jgi:metacaspase-1
VTKRALCVGINDYPVDGADLRGCVNDANEWATLLTEHYDFTTSDVRVMSDAEATKANIMAGLKDLLAGATEGDVLVFTNSSHGSYLPDQSTDEADSYDETLCPYDIDENMILDDELREVFSGIPDGVNLTMISDSCHSGSVTRVALSDILPGFRTEDDRRIRFLNPALVRDMRILQNPIEATPKRHETRPESEMKEILLTGCTDREVSYDAQIEGDYHGAMSYHALKAIREANYEITYADLASRLNALLEEARYYQHPQLEGPDQGKQRQIFT